MAPLTHDGKGNMLNTNADTIASEVAKALANDFETTLTFCFEKKGVLSNPQDDDSVIGEITPSSYESLKADGIISGGMIPKLENAFQSLKAGVRSVVITEAGELGKDTGTIVHL
jgi:acetylglutamate kinase